MPWLHYKTNATEHRYGYSSFIYNPLVTAKNFLSCIASSSQFYFPTIHREYHNQVLTQSINTSKKKVGISCNRGGVAVEVIATTASDTSRNEQIFPLISECWLVLITFAAWDMIKSQSIYMWDNVHRIIQRIESRIDFDSKITDLYDSQYCSKEYEDCSLQYCNFLR